jgi:putative addiction module component (TIGR02574 family)
MSKPIDRVEADALELSLRDRARLAQRLLQSLDEDVVEDPAEVERAWQTEIERRLAEYHEGNVTPIPASEVFREARSRLRRS